MFSQEAQSSAGMLEQIKEKAGILVGKAKNSKELFIDIGIYLCIGFLVGYFFKKGSRHIVSLIIFIGALVILNQVGILNISVNEARFYDFVGFHPIAGETTVAALWELIKAHIFIVVSFIVGFLFGIRMA